MAKVIIDKSGTKRYFNDEGKSHREDGPSMIWPKGGAVWKVNGQWMGAFHSDGSYYLHGDTFEIFRWQEPNGHKAFDNRDGGRLWPKL